MDYCSVTDVQGEFKATVFSGTSLVTLSSVASFITQTSALIDSYVGARWVTPVTGQSSLSLMQLYCITLVANRIRAILAVKQTTNVEANQDVKQPGMSTGDVLKCLADIKNGNVQLVDGTLLLASAGFYSNTSGVSPHFRKNRRQW